MECWERFVLSGSHSLRWNLSWECERKKTFQTSLFFKKKISFWNLVVIQKIKKIFKKVAKLFISALK